MSRIETTTRGKPITTTNGTPSGTPGKQTISGATTFPTASGDAHFEIASGANEAPRFLVVKAKPATATEDAEFYVCFWDPDVSQWHASGTLYAPGTTALTGNPGERSQIHRLECPEGATLGYFYVPSAPSGNIDFTARRGM